MNRAHHLRALPDTQIIFRDQSLLIAGSDGEVRGEGLQGLYYANTRLLRRLALRVDGRPPWPVQAAAARNDLLVTYAHAPWLTGDETDQDRSLLLQLTMTAGGGFHIDIDLHNAGPEPLACSLALRTEADFADLDEVRTGERQQCAEVRATVNGDTLRFDYLHPELNEAVHLRGSAPAAVDGDGFTWTLRLAPQERWHACLTVAPVHQGVAVEPVARCYGGFADAKAGRPQPWPASATRLTSASDSVRRSYDRAVSDLAALALRDGPPGEQAAFAAGIPIYHNAFGRDLLTTSWQALMATSALIESAILVCERTQGTRRDDFRDELPGRVVQRLRSGPLNLLGINPFGRYYSDYAAPADLAIMLGQHYMWTGDRAFARAHLPAALRALAWLDREGDLDGDGFYEYQTRSPMGDRNQGWKDSPHAIPHKDGRDAPLPVATCEVQGYVYAAKLQLAVVLLALGHGREARRLFDEARALKARFARAFWMPDRGCLAMALDGGKRQVRSLGSNAGHCLATGIVTAQHAPAVAGTLMSPELFSGWGVRTLDAAHRAYNPFSYHRGSVWPVEQATIAFGLKRYGFGQHTNAIAQGVFDLAEHYQLNRLPEAVGGLPRERTHPFPGLYPRACWPQAWSAGAVIMLLQAMLGLRPLAPLGLLLVYPELPGWLPEVTLSGLRIGGSVLTIRFQRQADGTTGYQVLERQGRVRVLRAPPDLSVRHGAMTRLAAPLLGALAGRL